MRVLDIDLDFFLDEVAHWINADAGRLDAADYPPWTTEKTLRFLETQCKLTRKVPGVAVERHGDVFARWRDAIDRGVLEPPFSVTHVDAHADLGLGDAGYIYLLTELVFDPPDARRFPRVGHEGFTDGNWLSFAVACRWISDLVYVFNTDDERPNDLMVCVMEGFNTRADNIQLAGLTREQLDNALYQRAWEAEHLEPKVPFEAVPWARFESPGPPDFISLARSPGFTPSESDALYGLIRERFVDELE